MHLIREVIKGNLLKFFQRKENLWKSKKQNVNLAQTISTCLGNTFKGFSKSLFRLYFVKFWSLSSGLFISCGRSPSPAPPQNCLRGLLIDLLQAIHCFADTSCCTRAWCGPARPLEMDLNDHTGKSVLHLTRPFHCASGLGCPPCMDEFIVSLPSGQTLGSVRQQWV